MGKTAVFVIAVLHQLDMKSGEPMQCLVLAHTRELASQIHKEFERLGKNIYGLRCEMFIGGLPVQANREVLKTKPPHIAIGTPGRVLDLVKSGHMNLDKIKFFILDECDKMLEGLGTGTSND
jgi:ATP-dependent RNA helicase UAP56/SUB2